ncbi:MFS transporter [Labrys sp. LIt4]|uniref:MFS transporter n=1 Tax=Labrys sp. LIt4 TaxID=2821355 RepID=UPI001ADF6DB1|nr:MFS transporter [Labrys sp. LIt4]MBP0582639.1 MFS transporter [Labrys sp. LIt4]
MIYATAPAASTNTPLTWEEKKVIMASSLGTAFEWYDFFLYGALTAYIADHFFSPLSETARFLAVLLAFAAGFLVRPFGALVFGRAGDLVGRKYTFLVTIVLMGVATFLVGLLPTYDWFEEHLGVGFLAPTILIGPRILQGLALGGEYGGAAVYVAEHAPQGKRGYFTSFIITTGGAGLFLALMVALAVRLLVGDEAFAEWGWRLPFLLSIVLLGISTWIRVQLEESPLFLAMKAEGAISKAPLKEAFLEWKNLKIVLTALFGVVAGQAVVGYTAQFYILLFMTKALHIDLMTASVLLACSLLVGMPFFVLFGWLSDKFGRKPLMLTGLLIAMLAFQPLFKAITHYGNPALEAALVNTRVTVLADPADCSVQFDPIGTAKFVSPCDVVKNVLASNSVAYANEAAPGGARAAVKVGDTSVEYPQTAGLDKSAAAAAKADFVSNLFKALKDNGYPVASRQVPVRNTDGSLAKNSDGSTKTETGYAMATADPNNINKPMLVLMLVLLVLPVTPAQGPTTAILVELFPTRFRYSALSLPYHVGNAAFGGMLPFIMFAMVAATGDIYFGLWFPIAVMAMAFVVGLFLIPETKDREFDHIST